MCRIRENGERSSSKQEKGQTLVLFAFGLMVFLGLVAMVTDVGLAYKERRDLQNAVDASALAAALDLLNGQSDATATATALDYMQRHNYSGPEASIQVNIPPTSGPYSGQSGYVEVIGSQQAPTAFLGLFREPFTVNARAVSEGQPGVTGGEGGEDGPPADAEPVPLPSMGCGSPVVDGRVTESDGYSKIGDLVGGLSDYGDAFVACDNTHYYLALVLNGPGTGGGVANENVYGCDTGEVKYKNGALDKIKGAIESVGASSFTIFAEGTLWTIEVDEDTDWKDGLSGIGDLIPGMGIEAKKLDELGPDSAYAGEVKDKDGYYCGAGISFPNYHADFNTGWIESPKSDHTFKDLVKSDRARFQLACDDVIRHDFIQDYLIDLGGGNWKSDPSGDGEVIQGAPTDSASSLEWNLEHPNETGWGDDLDEDPLSQSPPFNPAYPDYDPEYDGWIWEMIYEFKVPKQPYDNCSGSILFNLYNFAGQAGPLEGIHSSPAKVDDGAYLYIQARIIRLVE